VRSGRLWNVAAVKLFIDGTIDGGTAWLHDPDCHGQSTAPYCKDPRDYTKAVRALAQAGVQTAAHAIGDAAVGHVLDTLAEVVPDASVVRHRVEHIETLPADQIPRAGHDADAYRPESGEWYCEDRDGGRVSVPKPGPIGSRSVRRGRVVASRIRELN
jgi:Amidohydrolase family